MDVDNVIGYEFQFLIGRLKTELNSGARNETWCLFQFLIGRLKTSFVDVIRSLPNLFQFLIGRLKTSFALALCCSLTEFQFLIGRLKTLSSPHITPKIISCFNSL